MLLEDFRRAYSRSITVQNIYELHRGVQGVKVLVFMNQEKKTNGRDGERR